MANIRVSGLTQITALELLPSDLMYVIDVSAKEGKKVTLSDLGEYLNISGSLISVHAILADTASFIYGNNVFGSVFNSITSNFSTSSLSSSYSLYAVSASFAGTASYVINTTTGNAISASWASSSLSSSFATNANRANTAAQSSFLMYVTSSNNGTASYAITAQNTISSSYARNATSANNAVSSQFATLAFEATNSLNAIVASNLIYPNSSTASYAITAGNINTNNLIDYGVFYATTQSLSSSQLDLVRVTTSSAQTNIEVVGTIIIPYTSSIPLNESVTLVAQSRDSGFEIVVDSTPISVNVTPVMSNWNSLMSGSMKLPYSLMGSASLAGDYIIFVSSSVGIQIEPTRTNRFNMSSMSDIFVVESYESALFNLTPQNVTIEFTASNLGPFGDVRNGMIQTGSNNIDAINIRNKSVSSVRYVWSLPNLVLFDCGMNSGLTSLTGMPNSLQTFLCDSCSLNTILSIANTSISYFNCSHNGLLSLPALSPTMSYLNSSVNELTSIPSTFPYGMTQVYLNNNELTNVSSVFPSSITTMSFANNPITSFTSVLPYQLTYFDINHTNLTSIPTIPPFLLYLNADYCNLTQGAMNLICSESYANGLLSGSMFLVGNGPPAISTINNYIIPLQTSLGWLVQYDF